MTSKNTRYVSQNQFSGGIETRQEFLKPNQLLDAQNVWYPQGNLEQRPGGVAIRATPLVNDSNITSTIVWRDVSGETDTLVVPGTTALTAVAFGDYFTFVMDPAFFAAHETAIENTYGAFLSRTADVANSVTKTRILIEAWTSRGWVVIPYEMKGAMYPFSTTAKRNAVAAFALPNDLEVTTLTFDAPIGAVTGYAFRTVFVSATDLTGAPFTSGTIVSSDLGPFLLTTTFTQFVGGPRIPVLSPGSFLLKYAAGNLVVRYLVYPAPCPRNINEDGPVLVASVGNRLGINSDTWGVNLGSGDFFAEPYRVDQRYTKPAVPPSVAVIPEWNTAFVAFCGLVLEVRYGGPYTQTDTYGAETAVGPLVASVNTDPLIVGSISSDNPNPPYPNDQIPQLTNFPATNLLVYFKDRLWAVEGNILRWSGSATEGAYNVWPETSQVPLSTGQDNSPITAIAPIGDNLAGYKKNSIWLAIDNGIGDEGPGLQLFEPRLVVAGVGTVAPQSVQAFNGGLLSLAEDGFYFFNGTPDIKRISDPIKSYVDQINPARAPFAVATVWRTKQCYVCACSSRGETLSNDLVFLFDFQNGGWYIWEGLDVQCWFQQDGVGLEEELYALDSVGRAFQLTKQTQSDHGSEIDSWVLSGRFGFNDALTKEATEVRVRGINNNPAIQFEVIGDDISFNTPGSTSVDPVLHSLNMPKEGEQLWAGSPTSLISTWVPPRRRERHKRVRGQRAGWFQLKIYKALKLFGFDLGLDDDNR